VQPPLQPLAQRAFLERGDPECRHELTAAELGQHASVDLVGLAGQRRHVLDLARVGHLDLPAGAGEPIAHPHRPAHHLETGTHLRPQLEHEPRQPVLIGRHKTLA
jgi:hypothetical protein